MTLNLKARWSALSLKTSTSCSGAARAVRGLKKFPLGAPNVAEEKKERDQQFKRRASGGEPGVLSSRMLSRLQRSLGGTKDSRR